MKKFIILLLLIPLVSFGQEVIFDEWDLSQKYDEFGDPTGEKKWTFVTDGTFSNSATAQSPATLIIQEIGDEFVFSILEYKTNPASFLCDNIQVAVKTESGQVYRETKRKFETVYSNGIPIQTTGDYKYGDKEFHFVKPSAKRMKRIQKLRAKGIVNLYLLFANSKKEFKIALTCGQSKYNFKFKGLLSRENK